MGAPPHSLALGPLRAFSHHGYMHWGNPWPLVAIGGHAPWVHSLHPPGTHLAPTMVAHVVLGWCHHGGGQVEWVQGGCNARFSWPVAQASPIGSF